MNVFLAVGREDSTKLEKIKFGNILLRDMKLRNKGSSSTIKDYGKYYDFHQDLIKDP